MDIHMHKVEYLLFLVFASGKWTQETCERIVEKLFERAELPFPDNKIELFTDGNDDYTHILSDYYAETCIDYGQTDYKDQGERKSGR